ncbi:hypothetical protein C4901_01830 [Acidiferrobacter sp. SPIII_3]|jgi:hypothetical protein|uniref:hypothetical protein n=1 Tax=Acidiferrobacter sp. SPIII_3 TaxID=1281578 RepID=UPI000D72B115|nr:hypothetical protein [Acidiferrobacter sp. SPIII_3]AWP22246.1 hypothetical protein C4901_01830 [Acidiferrobacter sp. SPIII_3]
MMTAFNKRLAPTRILGLPLGAAVAGLTTVTGALASVVLPEPVGSMAIAAAIVAFPLGVGAILIGDDVVFAYAFWLSRRDARIVAREGAWH